MSDDCHSDCGTYDADGEQFLCSTECFLRALFAGTDSAAVDSDAPTDGSGTTS